MSAGGIVPECVEVAAPWLSRFLPVVACLRPSLAFLKQILIRRGKSMNYVKLGGLMGQPITGPVVEPIAGNHFDFLQCEATQTGWTCGGNIHFTRPHKGNSLEHARKVSNFMAWQTLPASGGGLVEPS